MTEPRIDINRAGEEELATLPGIGPALASRIIDYRTTVHPFEEVIELAAVPGISERMVREIDHLVTVAPLEATPDTATATAVLPFHPPLAAGEAPEDPPAEAKPEAEAEPETELESIIHLGAPAPEGEEMADSEPASLETGDEADATEPLDEENAAAERPSQPTVVTRAPAAGQRGWGCLLLVGLSGALLGALLALAVLFGLNSGLRFADATGTQREADQARSTAAALEGTVTALQAELARADGRFTSLDQDVGDAQADLARLATAAAALAEADADLADRLDGIASAAQDFETFLNRLRDLLFELQGAPTPTPTVTPSPSPTQTTTPGPTDASATAAPAEATPVATTRAAPATRTPRPTATPLVAPTATP